MSFGLRRGIGQREHDLDQGHAIGIAMVDASDQHATSTIIFHNMKLPEWLGMIKWRGRQFADKFFKLGLVGRAWQGGDSDMPIEIEIGIGFPVGTGRRIDCLLPEAAIGEEAFAEQLLDLSVNEGPGKRQHAGDHHQVGRPLHAQPGRIHLGHGLALAVC